MTAGDTPKELRQRAATLRSCAKRARSVAHRLDTYLGKETKAATGRGDALIWIGPYATDTTRTLQQREKTLRHMAGELTADARRWEREADALEHQAKTEHKAH